MSDDQKAAEQRRRMGLPSGLDPRNFDPRKAMDPATLERLMRAQAVARAEASAATTVLIGTVVTLITSAFGFVAALAWNDAIVEVLKDYVNPNFGALRNNPALVKTMYAVVATLIAVIVVVVLNRLAGRAARKSAISAAAGEGSY